MTATPILSIADTDDRARLRERRIAALIAWLPSWIQDAARWLRRPASRWVRLPAGALLVLGGIFSILPVLGLWMLPLGLILLAEDVPAIQRLSDRMLDWVAHRRPHWVGEAPQKQE